MLTFLLAFGPLAWLALRHTVDVPAFDHVNWNIVDLVEQALTGRLSFATVGQFHNEHLLLPTKLAIVLSAALTQGAQPLESLLSAATIAWAAALLASQAWRHGGLLAALAVVCTVASLNQWRNVTFAFMLQHGMTLLAAVLMARLSARPRLPALTLAATALLGASASGNGLLLLPIGALLWLVQALRERRPGDGWHLGAFVVGSLGIGLAYLQHAQGPPAPAFEAGAFVHSLLVLLANPVASVSLPARAALWLGLLLLALSSWTLLRWARLESRGPAESARRWRPLAVLLLFGLGSAVMIAARRQGEALLDPKYATTLNLIPAVVLMALCERLTPRHRRLMHMLCVAVAALFIWASLRALPAAALTNRFDRANAVGSFVRASAARIGHLTVNHGPVGDFERADLPTQFERLDRLGLLRPDLAHFEQALKARFDDLATGDDIAPPAGLVLSQRRDDPLSFDAVGMLGLDTDRQPPDALLVLVLSRQGARSVTVYPVAKSVNGDYGGNGWNRRSFGHLSERLDIGLAAPDVARVALVAVWLAPLRMSTPARLGNAALAAIGAAAPARLSGG